MNLEELLKNISDNDAAMLYFSGSDCGVCEALKPKIKASFDDSFPRIKQYYIDASVSNDITTNFSVFAVPTIIVFFNGKETIRKSRNLSIAGFIDEVNRPYNLFFN